MPLIFLLLLTFIPSDGFSGWHSSTKTRTRLFSSSFPSSFPSQVALSDHIAKLETTYVPVHTPDFYKLLCGGNWHLIYISGGKDSLKKEHEIRQEIVFETKTNGTLTNTIPYKLGDFVGTVTVCSAFALTPSSRMRVKLLEHRVEPSKGSRFPDNPEKMVQEIMRELPAAVWDPGSSPQGNALTFADGNFRVMQSLNEKHIFKRV